MQFVTNVDDFDDLPLTITRRFHYNAIYILRHFHPKNFKAQVQPFWILDSAQLEFDILEGRHLKSPHFQERLYSVSDTQFHFIIRSHWSFEL